MNPSSPIRRYLRRAVVRRRAEPRGTESLQGGGAAVWLAQLGYPPTKQPLPAVADNDHTERDASALRPDCCPQKAASR